jgi:acetyltransferase-like isoleucine patch superfamily enzyme
VIPISSDAYAELGEHCDVQEPAVVGLRYRPDCQPARIGGHAVIRAFSVIYADVVIGDHFKTGHSILIREQTTIGTRVVVGTGSVIDGYTRIGDRVKIESLVYVPTHTTIGSDVFVGPHATLTNDRYPQRMREQYKPEGPVLEDGVSVGAGATILPGVRIGTGSFIAAGAVVTRDVPPWSLVRGVPGRIAELPAKLRERNRALRW